MSSTPHEDDFNPAGTPARFYAVCTTARSGSTLLSHNLWRTGRMGMPMEYFNTNGPMFKLQKTFMCDSLAEYTDELLRRRTSPNGVFGMKLFFNHWNVLKYCGRYQRFKGLKLIHLRRQDRLAQAVSHRIASQTEQWVAHRAARGTPVYDFNALALSMKLIIAQERGWSELFAQLDVKPLRLTYEEFSADIDRHVAEVCRFVGVAWDGSAVPVTHPAPTRQTSALNVEWAARFKSDLARWKESRRVDAASE